MAFLVGLVLIASGCSDSKPGGQVVTPTPSEIIGKAPKPPAAVVGNAAAGKAAFTANGCAACHTFTPAAATGKVGPDLDNLAAYAAKANQPLAAFTSSAITAPPAAYVPPGFPTNVMPTTFSSLSAQELADLVAFLTKKS